MGPHSSSSIFKLWFPFPLRNHRPSLEMRLSKIPSMLRNLSIPEKLHLLTKACLFRHWGLNASLCLFRNPGHIGTPSSFLPKLCGRARFAGTLTLPRSPLASLIRPGTHLVHMGPSSCGFLSQFPRLIIYPSPGAYLLPNRFGLAVPERPLAPPFRVLGPPHRPPPRLGPPSPAGPAVPRASTPRS